MDTALVIANIALVLVTLALVLVTWRYTGHTRKQANETKRMADIMVREYERKNSPSLIEIEPTEASAGQVILKLSYSGDYPITIEKVDLRWWFREIGISTWIIDNRDKTMEHKTLSKNKPVIIPFIYDVEGLRKEEFPKSKDMSREELLSSVTGVFYLHYSDLDGNTNSKHVPIKNLKYV